MNTLKFSVRIASIANGFVFKNKELQPIHLKEIELLSRYDKNTDSHEPIEVTYITDSGERLTNLVVYKDAASFEKNDVAVKNYDFMSQIDGFWLGENGIEYSKYDVKAKIIPTGNYFGILHLIKPNGIYDTKEELLYNVEYIERTDSGEEISHKGIGCETKLTDIQLNAIEDIKKAWRKAEELGVEFFYNGDECTFKCFNNENKKFEYFEYGSKDNANFDRELDTSKATTLDVDFWWVSYDDTIAESL